MGGVNGIVAGIGWAVAAAGAYSAGGYLVPFLFALSTLRIKKNGAGVDLVGADAKAMLSSGFLLWTVPPLLLMWGTTPMLVAGAASLVTWFGFRLTVEVTVTRTEVVRKLAYVIPWSRRTHREPPRAFTDGWGDFADPEALNLGFRDGESKLVLAWGDKYSGTRCEDAAADFNAAVADLGNRDAVSPAARMG